MNSMNDLRQKAEIDDLVVPFFSTHGTPLSKTGDVHIVVYDTIVEPRISAWETSVSGEIIRDFVHRVKTKRVVSIMDVNK